MAKPRVKPKPVASQRFVRQCNIAGAIENVLDRASPETVIKVLKVLGVTEVAFMGNVAVGTSNEPEPCFEVPVNFTDLLENNVPADAERRRDYDED